MPFKATVLRVLIASPSDLAEERDIVSETINEWNVTHGILYNLFLLPVRWETDSAPRLGSRPQAIINQQLAITDCDLVIALFWTRIGTPTGVAASGTIEELQHFIDAKKEDRIMLYFSNSPINPDKIDVEQFKALSEYRDAMRRKGLIETFDSIYDFRHKFSIQLPKIVGDIGSQVLSESASSLSSQNESESNNESAGISDTRNEDILRREIDEALVKSANQTANENGLSSLAAVGLYFQKYTATDYKLFGYETFKKFVESRDLFEFEKVKNHPYIKLKKQ
jgi:hypothetical protein